MTRVTVVTGPGGPGKGPTGPHGPQEGAEKESGSEKGCKSKQSRGLCFRIRKKKEIKVKGQKKRPYSVLVGPREARRTEQYLIGGSKKGRKKELDEKALMVIGSMLHLSRRG